MQLPEQQQQEQKNIKTWNNQNTKSLTERENFQIALFSFFHAALKMYLDVYKCTFINDPVLVVVSPARAYIN